MSKVDSAWSLGALLRDYYPHAGWRNWFTEAFVKITEGIDPAERLDGWKTAAVIFGDMHAPAFCLFVCHYGRTLVPVESDSFLGHIDICLCELGLAGPVQPDEMGAVPTRDIGKPDTFRRNDLESAQWLEEQLSPFGGDLEQAAMFAVRLTAARFGLIPGSIEQVVAQILDALK